jgi:hypothetical protein
MSLDAFKETALANDYHFDIDGNLKGWHKNRAM